MIMRWIFAVAFWVAWVWSVFLPARAQNTFNALAVRTNLTVAGAPPVLTVNTLDDVITFQPQGGRVVQTRGYHAPGDGGHGLYRWTNSLPAGVVTNRGTWFAGTTGFWNLMRPSGVVDIRQFGARGDNVSDNTAAIQNAVDSCGFPSVMYVPIGNFLTGPITMTNQVSWVGDYSRTFDVPGKGSVLKAIGSQTHILKYDGLVGVVTNLYIKGGMRIEDITLDGNSRLSVSNPITDAALVLEGVATSQFVRMMIANTRGKAVRAKVLWDVDFIGCYFRNVGENDDAVFYIDEIHNGNNFMNFDDVRFMDSRIGTSAGAYFKTHPNARANHFFIMRNKFEQDLRTSWGGNLTTNIYLFEFNDNNDADIKITDNWFTNYKPATIDPNRDHAGIFRMPNGGVSVEISRNMFLGCECPLVNLAGNVYGVLVKDNTSTQSALTFVNNSIGAVYLEPPTQMADQRFLRLTFNERRSQFISAAEAATLSTGYVNDTNAFTTGQSVYSTATPGELLLSIQAARWSGWIGRLNLYVRARSSVNGESIVVNTVSGTIGTKPVGTNWTIVPFSIPASLLNGNNITVFASPSITGTMFVDGFWLYPEAPHVINDLNSTWTFRPATNTTSAWRLTDSNGVNRVVFDSVNGWLGVGATPTAALDVSGSIKSYRSGTEKFGQIRAEQAGAGDAVMSWILTGATTWSSGIDNSDNDSWKLSPSSDLSAYTIRASTAGGVMIGQSTPNASAALEVASTTGGILFPRVTTTQRDAFTATVDGLVIYNTTSNKLQVRAGGSWVDLH
jgi:hypothetical protein